MLNIEVMDSEVTKDRLIGKTSKKIAELMSSNEKQ